MIEVLAGMALGGVLTLLGVAVGCNIASRGQAFPRKAKASLGDA